MPRQHWGDEGHRGDERREYWSEGEDIRSRPHERGGGEERYGGTRDMDFGGGYGGGRDRGGGWSRGEYAGGRDRGGGWSREEYGSGREHLAGTRDVDDRWDRDRGYRDPWERDRSERWGESRRGEPQPYGDEGPGGGYRGGWGGTGGYSSSTGGYGASGLTGSTGWGRGGAGYSGSFGRGSSGGGGGFGGGGSYGGGRYGRGGDESYGSMYPSYGAEFGAQSWRGEGRGRGDEGWGRRDEHRWGGGEHEERGLMERMGDTFREGMAKLTGRGPKGYKRSDERIREDVCERIARSAINAENVEVQVENGEVTLSGEVESRSDKRRLEDMVDDIFGVDEVHNQLRMRRETPASAAVSDESRANDASRTGDDGGIAHH